MVSRLFLLAVLSVSTALRGADMNILQHGGVSSLSDAVTILPVDTDDAHRRADDLLSRMRKMKSELLSIPAEQRTFDNTVRALDEMGRLFGIIGGGLQLHSMLSGDLAGRNKPFSQVVAAQTPLFMDPAFYQAFRDYVAHGKQRETLDEEQKQYLARSLEDFEREGFRLAVDAPEKFAQLKELMGRLNEVCSLFSRNCDADASFITATDDELASLDPQFVTGLPRNDDGKCVVHCTRPNVTQMLSYCANPDVRERYWVAWHTRSFESNAEVLKELLGLRLQVAQLLGYTSYADYELRNLMIGSEKNAYNFITGLEKRAAVKWDKEFAELTKDLPAGVSLVDGKLSPWDVFYVVESYKKKQGVDDAKIAEYFPVQHTKQVIFDIYERFMDVTFVHHKTLPEDIRGGWHADCEAIEVRTKSGDDLLGFIILDLFPRVGKYNHACHAGTVPGIRYYDAHVGEYTSGVSVGVVVANFPRAVGDKPALLRHNDVTTFFHEFGHAMHYVFGRSSFDATTGTSVKRDFVEFPSQILEEWMWDKNLLCMTVPFQVTRHYKTGEPLPREMVENMVALKKCDSGKFLLRQLGYSTLSLRLHGDTLVDLDDVLRAALETDHISWDARNKMYTAFGHLAGYGSRYYGYMFSRAYAQDAFDQIKAHGSRRGVNGLIDPVVGVRFVSHILQPGGSIDPNILLRGYLGRAPSIDAFCKDLGL